MEFYHNAIMLRREITMLLLRDFGIKDKVRSVKSLYGVPGMVESARFRVCILSVGYVPIYDTGKESLSFRKVKKLIF